MLRAPISSPKLTFVALIMKLFVVKNRPDKKAMTHPTAYRVLLPRKIFQQLVFVSIYYQFKFGKSRSCDN